MQAHSGGRWACLTGKNIRISPKVNAYLKGLNLSLMVTMVDEKEAYLSAPPPKNEEIPPTGIHIDTRGGMGNPYSRR